jgi:myo-inositol-1(or 4)-monophosphatase
MQTNKAHAVLIAAAREAGEVALRYFKSDALETVVKADGSPLTAADLAVNAYLAERLGSYGSDIGWLSEETADAPDRLAKRRVWIVDPIDGTRNYAAGGDEWVISLALAEDRRPVAGVLFRPATGDLYEAFLHGGARRNGQAIRATDGDLLETGAFTGPQRIFRQLTASMPDATWLRSCPSLALRLARLAEGAIDVALVKGNAQDWDLAAADLILSEAGGLLTTESGAPLVYNQPEPRHPDLIGAGVRRHAALVAAIAAAPR